MKNHLLFKFLDFVIDDLAREGDRVELQALVEELQTRVDVLGNYGHVPTSRATLEGDEPGEAGDNLAGALEHVAAALQTIEIQATRYHRATDEAIYLTRDLDMIDRLAQDARRIVEGAREASRAS